MSTQTVTPTPTLPDPRTWFESAPTPATEAQTRKRRQSRKPASTPEPASTPKPERKSRKPAPLPEPAPTLKQVRCKPAISAPRTSNGFVPPAGVNYAARAREHIAKLLRSADGRKTVDDVKLLTASLISSGAVPAEYVHRPHVLYWRKQVLNAK